MIKPMKLFLLTAVLVLAASGRGRGAEEFQVFSAAVAADRSVNWQRQSILSGDFTCQEKREYAILGTRPKQIVIAIFQPPSRKPLDILLYSGTERHASSAVLTIEPLHFDPKQLEPSLG
jgi:hypothetical protein